MKKFGLIGKDIAASQSPALFKAAFKGKYPFDLLQGDDFAPLYSKFKKEYQAVNVTAPFKRDALAAADVATEAAELCGAANMLVKLPGGRVQADNSDFEGVALSVLSAYAMNDVDVDDEDAFDAFLSRKTALVAGCGGAGRAAAAALVSLGFGRTILMDRTPEKAEELKKHLIGFFDDLGADDIVVAPIGDFAKEFEKADMVAYAIPAKIDGISAIEDLAPNKGKYVLEACYNSPALDSISSKFNYISGYNWLLNQAIVSYEEFTGEEVDEDAMKKAIK